MALPQVRLEERLDRVTAREQVRAAVRGHRHQRAHVLRQDVGALGRHDAQQLDHRVHEAGRGRCAGAGAARRRGEHVRPRGHVVREVAKRRREAERVVPQRVFRLSFVIAQGPLDSLSEQLAGRRHRARVVHARVEQVLIVDRLPCWLERAAAVAERAGARVLVLRAQRVELRRSEAGAARRRARRALEVLRYVLGEQRVLVARELAQHVGDVVAVDDRGSGAGGPAGDAGHREAGRLGRGPRGVQEAIVAAMLERQRRRVRQEVVAEQEAQSDVVPDDGAGRRAVGVRARGGVHLPAERAAQVGQKRDAQRVYGNVHELRELRVQRRDAGRGGVARLDDVGRLAHQVNAGSVAQQRQHDEVGVQAVDDDRGRGAGPAGRAGDRRARQARDALEDLVLALAGIL